MGAVMKVQLLGSNTTVTPGVWFDASGFDKGFSVIFEGLVIGDTAELHVSNRQGFTVPDPTYDGILYGAQLTQDGIVKVLEVYGWVKVKRTAIAGGGTLNVTLAAARPAHEGY